MRGSALCAGTSKFCVYVHVIYVYALAYFACAQVLYVVREDLTLSPIVCLPSYTLSHGLQPVC